MSPIRRREAWSRLPAILTGSVMDLRSVIHEIGTPITLATYQGIEPCVFRLTGGRFTRQLVGQRRHYVAAAREGLEPPDHVVNSHAAYQFAYLAKRTVRTLPLPTRTWMEGSAQLSPAQFVTFRVLRAPGERKSFDSALLHCQERISALRVDLPSRSFAPLPSEYYEVSRKERTRFRSNCTGG